MGVSGSSYVLPVALTAH